MKFLILLGFPNTWTYCEITNSYWYGFKISGKRSLIENMMSLVLENYSFWYDTGGNTCADDTKMFLTVVPVFATSCYI